MEKARLQGDNNFQFSVEELQAFIWLGVIRAVMKGRDEPVKSFWNADYGRPVFEETIFCLETNFSAYYLASGLMTKIQDQEDAYKTSLPL